VAWPKPREECDDLIGSGVELLKKQNDLREKIGLLPLMTSLRSLRNPVVTPGRVFGPSIP